MDIANTSTVESVDARSRIVWAAAGITILMAALLGLFYYKWGGSIRTLDGVRAAGQWTSTAEGITAGGVMKATLFYFNRVWLALVFGILIGAIVRTFISPRWVAGLLGQGSTLKRQLAGGLAGAPLMLCSCCVTPIFTGIIERGARLGSALAVMLAAPGLNLAALVLTFLLFPIDVSIARLAAVLVTVFLLPSVLEHVWGGSVRLRTREASPNDELPRTVREAAVRFARSLAYITLVTVPLIAAGVFLSGLILPGAMSFSAGGAALTVIVIAAAAVLVALPTFFEIPLALLLMGVGAPGAAAALLVAGPIINLPSLFVLGRETNMKVASALAVGIWLIASVAGLAVLA